jgi:hypothetical protein
MWCWRRMEKIGWTYHVRNEKVLHRIEKGKNILQKIKEKDYLDWSILRRSCLLKHVRRVLIIP